MPFIPDKPSTPTSGKSSFIPNNQSGFPTQEPAQVHQSLMSKIGGGLGSYFKNVGSDYKQGTQAIGNDISAGYRNAQNGNNSTKDALGGGLQAAGEFAKMVFAPITEAVKPAVTGFAHNVVDHPTPLFNKLANGSAGDKVVSAQDAYAKWQQQHPEAAKNLEASINVAGLLTADEPANALTSKAKEIASDVGSKTTDLIQKTDVRANGEASFNAQSKIAQDKLNVGKSIESDWAKPTTVPKPAYNKATEIYNNAKNKGSDISETLVKNKINPTDNIDNGKYSTTDTAAKIRSDAIKASNDGLRPSLELADHSTPKTPVLDIIKDAQKSISSNKSMTLGDRETALARLDRESAALQKNYPDGMSLTDMHDNKITYSQNAGHNPIGTRDDNLIANTNNALADTMKRMVEEKAPANIPVKPFNFELQKLHQAANYLEALHGKTVPQSLVQKIAKTTAKVVGAAVGNAVGGGILGGVGGYHIGGMLEGMFENMPNPFKAEFLNNLEKTNPEAFKAVQDYIGQERSAQLTRKALPAPAPLGSAKNPIIPKAPNSSVISPGLEETKNAVMTRKVNVKGTSESKPVTQIFSEDNKSGRFTNIKKVPIQSKSSTKKVKVNTP